MPPTSSLRPDPSIEDMDVGKRLSLGGSLPVPNVQALADAASGDQLAVISDRYIRPELEEEAVVLEAAGGAAAAAAEEIPIVDLGKLLGDSQPSRAEEAAKLRSACEDWGFFQLVNHGVPEEVMRRMAAAVEGFFAQSLQEKMASSKQPAGSTEGYGQQFVVSEEQKLEWGDVLYLVTRPPHFRNLAVWPTHPPTFRSTLEEYSLETKRVALCLLAAMGDNLGLPPGKLVGAIFTEGIQSIRMNYYPPCRHHAGRVLGVSPHSDRSGLNLLFQTSDVPGLQIRGNGRWLAVDPLPGSFVVNIGDVLEMITNGRYRSIEHRAVVDRERRRLSIATFLDPRMDGFVGPLEDLVARDGGRPLYKTVTTEEFFRQIYANKLNGKKFLDCCMKLDR